MTEIPHTDQRAIVRMLARNPNGLTLVELARKLGKAQGTVKECVRRHREVFGDKYMRPGSSRDGRVSGGFGRLPQVWHYVEPCTVHPALRPSATGYVNPWLALAYPELRA